MVAATFSCCNYKKPTVIEIPGDDVFIYNFSKQNYRKLASTARMFDKNAMKKEIILLAEKVRSLSGEGMDLNALQSTLHELNEKIILLRHLESFSQEKANEPFTENISSDSPPDSKKQTSFEPENKKKETMIDLFGNEVPSVHQKISKNKEDQSLASHLQKKKIEDLKAAIGINEKFRFINELFHGNANEYHVAITQVNNFTSRAEAENYIAGLKDVYNWGEDTEIVLEFMELVERRFL
jgi:hypothetical protein